MSDAQNPPVQQSSRPQVKDPLTLLSSLIPVDRAERRRAVAALLRAVVGDEQQEGM